MNTPLPNRLWIYQAERFPVIKTLPLLAMFSAASVTLSAVLGARTLPGVGAYVVAFVLVFLLFFQMRVCDEVKDAEDDRRFRPERPIPRGLIRQSEIVGLGVATIPLALAAAFLAGYGLVWLLLLVWGWLALMTIEFGAPRWLKARPVLYLLSHMAIMPLIDLLLTGVEWLRHGAPHPGLWLFFALSFSNGCVLELGRKLWAPGNEREGVETYSSLWGPRRAASVWVGCVAMSFLLLTGVGIAVGHPIPFVTLGALGFSTCVWIGRNYAERQLPGDQSRVDTVAGLWVFLCYAIAGFVPLLFGTTP
ncbi:MAG: UbiA family prenyltransferase [Pseudomonadota bacterium]